LLASYISAGEGTPLDYFGAGAKLSFMAVRFKLDWLVQMRMHTILIPADIMAQASDASGVAFPALHLGGDVVERGLLGDE